MLMVNQFLGGVARAPGLLPPAALEALWELVGLGWSPTIRSPPNLDASGARGRSLDALRRRLWEAALAALKGLLNGPTVARSLRRIEVESWAYQPVQESPAAAVSLSLPFGNGRFEGRRRNRSVAVAPDSLSAPDQQGLRTLVHYARSLSQGHRDGALFNDPHKG